MASPKDVSYVEIDDADPEHTQLWVSVNNADRVMVELIEEYPISQRVRAFAMARRLADLLGVPLKLLKNRDREAEPVPALRSR